MFEKTSHQNDDKMIDELEQSAMKEEPPLINKENLVRKSSRTVKDVYLLDRKLGEGSFGTVFLVTHKQLKVQRALKIISKNSRSSSNPADELELLKKLDHPNIIKIYEYFQTREKWYIVTQYFDGRQLFDEVLDEGRLSEKLAAKIIYEILKAIAYIHSNKIAHRDIKAENILVKRLGDEYIIKVIDWGLGVLTKGEDLSRRCGTPQYCAPEVLMGHYNLECDMWSVGVLLYIMLSGNMPFKGNNLKETIQLVKKGEVRFKSSVWSTVSDEAKNFILKLIEKDCSLRFTAVQCLNEPWIISHLSSVTSDELNLRDTLQRLKEFRVQTRFQVVVINYILNFIQAPIQIQRLKRQFEVLDINKDGSISYQQLLFAYRKIYGYQADLMVQKIFKNVDLDGSGGITFSQFVTFASEITYNFNNQQLRQAFKLFDLDSDGLIDRREINSLIAYEKGSSRSEDFNEVVNEIDLNNDGKIDFDEFKQHVNKAVEKIKTKSASIKLIQSESKFTPTKDISQSEQLEKTFVLSEEQFKARKSGQHHF